MYAQDKAVNWFKLIIHSLFHIYVLFNLLHVLNFGYMLFVWLGWFHIDGKRIKISNEYLYAAV